MEKDELTERIIGCAMHVSNSLGSVLNYLKATGIKVGLLLNFGSPQLGIKHLVF